MSAGTRDRILEAARDIGFSEGFRAVTMRRVAGEVGLTAPALYRHFEGKAGLLAELMDRARERFLSVLAPCREGGDVRDRFWRASDAYLAFALDHPHDYELLFMSPNQAGLLGAPASVESWSEEPPETFGVAVERVVECMHAGLLRDDDPIEVTLALSAAAHGLVSLYLAGRFGPDPAPFRTLYRRSMSRLLTGLCPPGTEMDP
jgi:AcrR family transcriptional regulator